MEPRIEPIGAALLGAGLFSKDVYAKLFRTFEDVVTLKTVWSRSSDGSSNFIKEYAPGAAASHGDEGLDGIMEDSSIELVVVVLPVQAALTVVQRALAAGKHVIEEKPVSGTVGEALAAIRAYRAAPRSLWLFAENYRYERVFLEAAKVALNLGTILKVDVVADMPVSPANKYWVSQWRRDTEGCPGGQLMETSVHHTAALRLLASAAGLGEAVSAAAHSSHNKPDLSNPDTVSGVVRFASGIGATISISLAAAQVRWSLTMVGTEGSLEVSRGGWTGSRGAYTLSYRYGEQTEPTIQQFNFSGMQDEFQAFLQQIHNFRSGTAVSSEDALRSSPEEGARDLALLEALLSSGAQQGQVVAVAQVPGP